MPSTVAILLVLVAGLPPAYALTRNVLLAVLVAPLITAVVSAVAVIIMLVVGGKMLLWVVVLLLALYAAVPLLLRRRREALPHGSWIDILCYGLPLIPPFLMILEPPALWDAHSIWWLHAALFTKDPGFARAAIGSPAFYFSHSDYPPLASAVVSTVWSVLGGYSFRVAQAVSSLVTFSAIATLGYVVRSVTSRGPVAVSRLAGVGVSLAAWGAAPYAVAGGMTDPLWSAAFVAAAVLLLFGNEPFARPMLPLLLLTVATLTKNEGFVAGAVLAAFVTLRERRNLRRAWWVWLPVASGLAWTRIVRYLGAVSDVTDGHVRELLAGDQGVLDRLPPTLDALQARVGLILAFSLGAAVLGGIFLRRHRRELGLGSDVWLWLTNAVFAASLIVTYLISLNGIQWYLATSADRVTLPIALMAAASAACWAAVVFGARDERRSAPAVPAGTDAPGTRGRHAEPATAQYHHDGDHAPDPATGSASG